MITEAVTFKNNIGQTISGRVYAQEPRSQTGVIFCHGLFSSKDGYKITRLAADIVSAGFTLMTFDFSFAGESGGNISDISVKQEVEDLACAVEFFRGLGMSDLHLMGSSMGGAVALLYAAAGRTDLKSLALVATPTSMRDLIIEGMGVRRLDSLPEDGVTWLDSIPIKNSFFREAEKIDMTGALKRIDVPLIVIHGARDSIVSVSHAERFRENCSGPCSVIIVPDGDHNLTRDKDLDIIRDNIIGWFSNISRREGEL